MKLVFLFIRIINCQEFGLTDKWLSDIFEYHRKNIGTIDKKKKDLIIDFSPITLQNVSDNFYLMLFGFAISLIILLIELSRKMKDNQAKSRKRKTAVNNLAWNN